MSGGSFSFAYSKVQMFCDELDLKLEDDSYNLSDETKKTLFHILAQAYFVSELMKEVEWLYSYDTSEETFKKRIDKIIDAATKPVEVKQ